MLMAGIAWRACEKDEARRPRLWFPDWTTEWTLPCTGGHADADMVGRHYGLWRREVLGVTWEGDCCGSRAGVSWAADRRARYRPGDRGGRILSLKLPGPLDKRRSPIVIASYAERCTKESRIVRCALPSRLCAFSAVRTAVTVGGRSRRGRIGRAGGAWGA